MQTMPQTPTLNDVADRSGYSTATVSRCLNFPERVSEATRAKVMKAINDLGYSPNFGARVMAAKRTYTIGAIIPTMENAIFARGLQAFQEELNAQGYTLLVASSSYRADLEEEQIRNLVARGADALLLIGFERDPSVDAFLEKQGVPALVTWALRDDQTRPSVGFDNVAAMRAMAAHVIGLGHQQMAIITADPAMNDRAADRLKGVRLAMEDAAIDPDSLLIHQTPYGIENGATEFGRVMAADPRPTVVFCGNDVLAVGALRKAREMGLRVPQDVSIVGFDDIELAQVAYPALATVHVPHREMGRRAAIALISLLRDGTPLQSVPLQADLRLRASLGPPP